jgi:protoporphyrinogen oxidase
MNVCVIGGGMMGLATAYFLAGPDVHVTVFEKEKEVGGLSRPAELLPGLLWDRYYHVILSTDVELLNFLNEIGLSLDIRFKATKTGFVTDGRLHPMSNIMEFLCFKPLSLLDKLRLGTGIFFASRIRTGGRLENIYAKTWLIHIFGRRNYEKLWDPLLRSKLGSASSKASGSFIWAIIKRYYGTRHKGSKQEFLGCVQGGYHSILRKIKEKLQERKVNILLGQSVVSISPSSNGSIAVLDSQGNKTHFDNVVATIPNPNIIPLLPCQAKTLKDQLNKIDYLNLICVVLVIKKSLCPFYITNITDSGFPFTGVIEATNIVPKEILGNHALVYLPRWMPADDPFINLSDSEIIDRFYKGLRAIFPEFSAESVTTALVHREFNVQPIQTVGYKKNVVPMATCIKGFYVVNTTMILNSTLNNNQVIRLARKMAEKIKEDTSTKDQPAKNCESFFR